MAPDCQHPDGRGTVQRRPNRAEYLGDGDGTTERISESVIGTAHLRVCSLNGGANKGRA
jgi:hypothetical protein